MDDPPAFKPIMLSTADLLHLADAFPLLDRLALLFTIRTGGDRKTIIFGILDGLQGHLDSTVPADRPRGVQETIDTVQVWFNARIAEVEDLAA